LINSDLKERLIDTIALLNVPGIGRGRFAKLVKRYGSPGKALAAKRDDLMEMPGLSEKTVGSLVENQNGEQAREIAARIAQLGWEVLFPDSEGYPPLLARADDHPPLLFRVGEPVAADDKMIAIVGTRHASEQGRRFTHRLAADLARDGLTIVSGMAEGIDSAAHRGALDGGGKTVAVWGTPLDKVYPPSNRELAEKIRTQGAIYSEYLPGVEASPANFPDRNRIISGMSEGVIVIEAGQRSGALITARCALDQGRELFAVPGSPWAARSIGTNQLIKAGAKALTCADDVFDEIPRLKGEITARKFKQEPDLTEIERRLVDLIAPAPIQIDQLSRAASMTVSELLEYLLALELKGVVEELPGKRFVLTDR
jgi:DNA processing protein